MRAREILINSTQKFFENILQELSRRDLIKGAAGAAALSTVPKVIAGQFQSHEEITKDREEFSRIWVPRYQGLQARAESMLGQLLKTVGPKYANHLSGTKISVISTEDYATASSENRTIGIDLTVFWDAPESTLAFVIAHELGHILFGHRPHENISQLRQEELAADQFAVDLCKSLGYNKVELFRFFHQQEEEYRYYKFMSQQSSSTHPSFDERIRAARQKGFQLSQGGIKQMLTITNHLS